MFGHEAILGLLIPFIGTSTGAACVFFMKKNLSKAVQRLLPNTPRTERMITFCMGKNIMSVCN